MKITINELEETIKTTPAVLVYFSSEKCSVCSILKPKLEKTISHQFPKINFVEIDSLDAPEIPAHFQIYSLPAALVFFEGKLNIQKARVFSIKELTTAIERSYNLAFH